MLKRAYLIKHIIKRAVDLDKIINYYGTTYNLEEAGYILPDGSLLDFSLKNHGAEKGTRSEDHRGVCKFIDKDFENVSDKMDYFMKESGAIRISFYGDYGLIDFETKPTTQQMNVIQRIIARKKYIDISLPNSNEVLSFEFEYDRSSRAKALDVIRKILL